MERARFPFAYWFARVENWLLVTLLTTLIVLAVTQMLGRNLLEAGWVWMDPMMRTLVLWVGLTGAMIATREHKHITILVARDRLPHPLQVPAEIAAHLITAAVSGLIGWHAARLVQIETEAPIEVFLDVPSWVTQLIIPAAFAIIAARALYATWCVLARLRARH